VISINAVGNKLCIGTQDSAGYDFLQPLTANSLRLLDVNLLLMGAAVNVPGTFVQYEPDRKLLVVRDDQWDTGWNYTTRLRSLSWDGSASLEPLDTMKLPAGFNTVQGRGARIFIDASSYASTTTNGTVSSTDESRYSLYAAQLNDAGTLDLGDPVLVTKQWGSLFDAHGSRAYVSVGNALAVYDFSGTAALAGLYETMGYPTSICFGAENAYVSFGYAGLAKIPL
jgi:hypothetical protein